MPIATPQGTLDFKSVDKVTFVGASSNTVIDTTTGSLGVGVGVGGPTSNLHVVGNTRLEGDINMLHTANTATIKLNSNVVTEFPRSKKLIKYPRVLLTSAALNSAYENGYKVTFSSEATSYRAYHPFSRDENSAVGWHSNDGTTGKPYDGTGGLYGTSGTARLAAETERGEWLGLELPVAIKLERLRMVSQDYSPAVNTIDDFIVYAKKQSGDTWTNIGTFTGIALLQTSADGAMFDVNVVEYYKFFAIVATKRDAAAADSGVSIRVLEYFGVPEYDPDADGTDVTLKSMANVPTTDWLEIYYDAKDLEDGAVTNPISGLGGTTNGGTAVGDTQVSNGAFVFDGSGDYIYNSQSGYTSRVVYTGCAWIKKASKTNGCIFQFGNGSNNSGIGLFSFGSPTETKTMRAFVYGGADADYTGDLPLNEWFHVVAVISDKKATLYLNGVVVATDTGSTTITIPSTPYLSLGVQTDSGNAPFSSTYFDGSIANFRLFNRNLTTDEIYQLYAYQKEEFGHSTNNMTLKAGRLGIGTSEPGAALDVRGDLRIDGHSQLETLAPRYYSSMQRGTFHNVSSHIITGFDHQAEGYATPVLGWEVHINFNHHRNSALHVEIDGGYMSTATGTHVAISETATRRYDEDTSAFTFYTDKFYIGSHIAHAHAAAYAVIRITNSQVPGIPSAIHAGNGSTVRYHMLGHTMYVRPGVGSTLDVAMGQIPGSNNARLHGIRVATSSDNMTGAYTVYTYH
tara:strand:+ start:1736 stop:3958 length:2223 start_codon:yes stop_codon:yes gene_type:complete